MSNDRQALDRAIERLENSINWLQHGRDAGKLLALEDMKALHAALASPAGEAVQEQPQPAPCAWSQDGDDESDTWATACGNLFVVTDGKPSENDMRFCCYCGKPLEEHQIEFEDDEDGQSRTKDRP